MLLDNYLYIGWYYYVYELIKEKLANKQQKVKIRLYINLQQDQRTHNLPNAEKIVVSNKCSSSDITYNGTWLYSISNKCSSYTDNEH